LRYGVEYTLGRSRSDAWQQVEEPKARNTISRVLDEAQDGQDVLDMGRV
jgi:hypothetical protein